MIRQSISEDPAQDPYGVTPSEVQGQAQVQDQPSTEPNDHPSVLLDVLAAPFRGVEDAARNVYGLADFLTADALPNWEKNFTGTSQTTAGSVVENVAEFLTGFIPAVGVAGKLGKAAGLAGKAGKLASAAAAGAVTDFTVFSGKEERLSNLIQSHPALANPVTEYLSAKPGDGEIEGRFKNALEGLGLGALTDGILGSLNVVKAGRAAKAGELSAEAAQKIAQENSAKVGDSLLALKKEDLKGTAAVAPAAEAAPRATVPEMVDLSKQLAAVDLDKLGGGGLFQSPDKFVGRFLDSPTEITDLLQKTSQEIMAKEEARGVQTVEAIATRTAKVSEVLGELSGSPAAAIIQTLRSQNQSMQLAAYTGEAAARLMLATANEASFYAKAVASGIPQAGLTMEQTILHSLKAQELLTHLVATVKQTGTIEGRALNARKFIKGAQIEAQAVAAQMVEQLGGSPYLTVELRKMALAGASDDAMAAAKGVSDLIRKQSSLGDRLLRVHNEYWMNAILSGTKTSFVNTLGNTMTTLYQPLEQAIGGAFQLNGKAVAASLKNYVYLAHSVSDSWKFAIRAFKENENVLVKGSAVKDIATAPAISGKALLGESDSSLAHFMDFVGSTVRMPSRLLLTADEGFKQLNYRAAAKTELYYRGLDKGLTGDALHSFVSDGFSKVITEGGEKFSEDAVIRAAIRGAEERGLTGQAKNAFIHDYKAKNWDPTSSALKDSFDVSNLAKGVADEATFTTELGALGRPVQKFVQAHPAFQLLIPFVRTPTNIVKYFSQRGLGVLTYMPGIGKLQARNVAELASADALVRSRAMGRIATGQMLVSTAAITALSGKITGHGPSNAAELANLKATGWQPYSIKFETADGPHYVSYARIDPFATFLGLVADWSEQAKRQDPFMQDTLQATLTAAATAVSHNVTNKTYLASLAQAIDAINQPDRKFAAWSRARVGSYVPSLLAQWNSGMDDGQSMKEVRGFFDGAINRIPGAQGMLESKRNVLGEPVDATLAQTPLSAVNPFTLSKDKGDVVFNEIAQFNHGLQAPSPVVFGKVNLLEHKTEDGRTAFDRWQELTGTVTIGGKTLRGQLERLIGRSDYQKLPLTEPTDGYDTPRLGAVRGVIESYRKAALGQLQKEVPSVGGAIRDYQLGQAALRRGDRAQALDRVQAVIASVK